MPGQPVPGTYDVFSEPQPWVTLPAIQARGLCLHPVEKREAQLPGCAQVRPHLFLWNPHQGAEPVVDLRPIDQAYVAGVEPVLVVFTVEDASEVPEIVGPLAVRGSVEDRPGAGS